MADKARVTRLYKRRPPRELTDEDVQEMLASAAARHRNEAWRQIETFLDDLTEYFPGRVGRIRKDLRWLKRQAIKRGLDWGPQ